MQFTCYIYLESIQILAHLVCLPILDAYWRSAPWDTVLRTLLSWQPVDACFEHKPWCHQKAASSQTVDLWCLISGLAFLQRKQLSIRMINFSYIISYDLTAIIAFISDICVPFTVNILLCTFLHCILQLLRFDNKLSAMCWYRNCFYLRTPVITALIIKA